MVLTSHVMVPNITYDSTFITIMVPSTNLTYDGTKHHIGLYLNFVSHFMVLTSHLMVPILHMIVPYHHINWYHNLKKYIYYIKKLDNINFINTSQLMVPIILLVNIYFI